MSRLRVRRKGLSAQAPFASALLALVLSSVILLAACGSSGGVELDAELADARSDGADAEARESGVPGDGGAAPDGWSALDGEVTWDAATPDDGGDEVPLCAPAMFELTRFDESCFGE